MTPPNILLLTCDQLRADCLSLAGHPDLLTPNLDQLAGSGAWFRSAYTPAPVSCPARRSILSGCSPASDGCLDNSPVRIPRPDDTLPHLLRRRGYQTADIGRGMHQYPHHARYGFEIREESPFHSHDSHVHWTLRQTSQTRDFSNWPHLLGHGMPVDGYGARPWPYDEAFHQTTWTVNKAIEFADRRDRDVPFFLHVGFVAPHPPLVPPAFHYERYARRQLAPPVIGDWASPPPPLPDPRQGPYSAHIPANEHLLHETMAGYYGLIDHMDNQLHNLLWRFQACGDVGPTCVLFCSDHGDMLGDHHCFRKSRPYEGASRVPFLLSGPGIPAGLVIDAPVTLEDILPTCCELAGAPVPAHVEGRSVLPLLRGTPSDWREWVHSEGPTLGDTLPGFHSLGDGQWKYIWFSASGHEQLFHLAKDPRERHDLSSDPRQAERMDLWRTRLARHLAARSEGFVQEGRLVPGRPHRAVLPHAVPV